MKLLEVTIKGCPAAFPCCNITGVVDVTGRKGPGARLYFGDSHRKAFVQVDQCCADIVPILKDCPSDGELMVAALYDIDSTLQEVKQAIIDLPGPP